MNKEALLKEKKIKKSSTKKELKKKILNLHKILKKKDKKIKNQGREITLLLQQKKDLVKEVQFYKDCLLLASKENVKVSLMLSDAIDDLNKQVEERGKKVTLDKYDNLRDKTYGKKV